jgi:transposase-like protein
MNALELHERWQRGDSVEDLAAHFGVSEGTVKRWRSYYKLPRRSRTYRPPAKDPTPEEIAKRAAEIRERHLQAMREAVTISMLKEKRA